MASFPFMNQWDLKMILVSNDGYDEIFCAQWEY
jgi:hypothetical protein